MLIAAVEEQEELDWLDVDKFTVDVLICFVLEQLETVVEDVDICFVEEQLEEL